METTALESRPAIQKYLTALEARLRATPGRAAAGSPVEAAPVEAGLADAREFLLSEWESLRESGAEPADDEALYEHFVAKFGSPDEVAAGYGAAAPTADSLAATASPPITAMLRGRLALPAGAAIAIAIGGAVIWFALNRDDGPTTVPAVEPAGGSAVRPTAASFAPGELRTSWAERVVSYRYGADEPRDPPTASGALGKPDCRRPDVEPEAHVVLGDGGELVVEFVTHTVVDGPGPDLAVHELGYFEPVRVAASENGTDWFELGISDQRLATFDLATGGLASARFVRITDARSGRSLESPTPGAEIDSIAALNSVAVLKSETAAPK